MYSYKLRRLSSIECRLKISNLLMNPNATKTAILWPHRTSIDSKFPTSRYFTNTSDLTQMRYEEIANETMDNLTDFFDSLPETAPCPNDYDVCYADGVLTVHISKHIGTYVINKQSPNKQIWLSSPLSGPKRYDLIDGQWIYTHDNTALYDLLREEFSQILAHHVNLYQLDTYINK